MAKEHLVWWAWQSQWLELVQLWLFLCRTFALFFVPVFLPSNICKNIVFLICARLVVLITFLAVLSILCRTCVPWLLKLMISLSSQVWLFAFIHNIIENHFALCYKFLFLNLCRPMNYINWHQLHSACL